ncbi:hypothetical protein PAMP_023830 [Pampus punctatissimus]
MMDPEVSLLLDCAAWRGLWQSQVQVEISERFNRRTDVALERHIEEMWTERVAREPWLFNGAKFRLHSFRLASSSSSSSSSVSPQHSSCTLSSHITVLDCSEEKFCATDVLHDAAQNSLDQRNLSVNQAENVNVNVTQQTASRLEQVSSTCDFRASTDKNTDNQEAGAILTMRLGLTCYKDYLGTNWSCRVAELRQRGEEEFSDPLALLAQPLGVGAVLCTEDGQVVLIRRSQRVAEAGGLLDIPGGHPEPKAVCEEQVSLVALQQRLEAVVAEFFSSVCAEIRDEVNVPLSSLREPVLMGVALNHTSAGRPSAEFYVSCSLTSDEVRKLYWKGGAEAHESTDIIFLSRTEMLQLNRSSALWSELCPSAKGAVLLYQSVKPDGEQNLSKRPSTAQHKMDPDDQI